MLTPTPSSNKTKENHAARSTRTSVKNNSANSKPSTWPKHFNMTAWSALAAGPWSQTPREHSWPTTKSSGWMFPLKKACDAPTKHPPGPLSQARQESILRCATSSLSMNAHPYTAKFPVSKLAPTTAHPRKWWLIFCDILKPSAEFSIFCERTARAHHRRHRTEPL